MSIVHVHIERTGGVSMQELYENKFGGDDMLWYIPRPGDHMFAPFGIETTTHLDDTELQRLADAAKYNPDLKNELVARRTELRRERAVTEEDIASRAEVVTGHFSVSRVIEFLPPSDHEYRSVIREPLSRMWSHFSHWRAHNGNVGQRIVLPYEEDLRFEDFALNPHLLNYQAGAIIDLSYFEIVGMTERIDEFTVATGLTKPGETAPNLNHFSDTMPILSDAFRAEFHDAHEDDYAIYQSVSDWWTSQKKCQE